MDGEAEHVEADLSAGVFTWEIAQNKVYADRAAAFLFGLHPIDAARGLPIERFIGRVHEEDQPNLAREIAESMRTSEPFQMQYRVHATSNFWVDIMAFGHCFRDADGEPKHFSGIVHPVPVETDDKSGLWHILAAHEVYKANGEDEKAEMVLSLLTKLTNPGENPLNIVRLHR